MYRAAAFAEDDPGRLGALIKAHPLACVVAHGPKGLIAAHAPLVAETDAEGRIVGLIGHLARANPFWSEAGDGAEVLAVFSGPDAYVSASFYPSKSVHGRVVPTWNYQRIEVRGRISIVADAAGVRPYIEVATQAMEADRSHPWSVEDAPADFLGQLSLAIVGFRIAVTNIAGTFKLSQNKRGADFEGVLTGLSQAPDHGSRAVATLMGGGRA